MEKLYGKKLERLTGCCLILAGILLAMTGCSHGPRNEYARDLTAALDKVYANLEQYRKNPGGEQYKTVIHGTPYRVVWITPDGRLWFATAPVSRQGVFPEALLRSNFRGPLDNIHNQDKKKG